MQVDEWATTRSLLGPDMRQPGILAISAGARTKGAFVGSIYLAGKIAKGDWRHDVVDGLRESSTDRNALGGDVQFPSALDTSWPGQTYVGPFFAGCDHGCAHGRGTHARAGGCTHGHSRPRTARDCLEQIDRADIIFAWLEEIEDLDCNHSSAYGTLFELGYAKALQKRVVVAAQRAPVGLHDETDYAAVPAAIDDLWFAWTLATDRVVAATPREALALVLDDGSPSR